MYAKDLIEKLNELPPNTIIQVRDKCGNLNKALNVRCIKRDADYAYRYKDQAIGCSGVVGSIFNDSFTVTIESYDFEKEYIDTQYAEIVKLLKSYIEQVDSNDKSKRKLVFAIKADYNTGSYMIHLNAIFDIYQPTYYGIEPKLISNTLQYNIIKDFYFDGISSFKLSGLEDLIKSLYFDDYTTITSNL